MWIQYHQFWGFHEFWYKKIIFMRNSIEIWQFWEFTKVFVSLLMGSWNIFHLIRGHEIFLAHHTGSRNFFGSPYGAAKFFGPYEKSAPPRSPYTFWPLPKSTLATSQPLNICLSHYQFWNKWYIHPLWNYGFRSRQTIRNAIFRPFCSPKSQKMEIKTWFFGFFNISHLFPMQHMVLWL